MIYCHIICDIQNNHASDTDFIKEYFNEGSLSNSLNLDKMNFNYEKKSNN